MNESTMSTIEMVRGDKKVTFTHYRGGELWYITDCGFAFPVPVSEADDATFLASDKAMMFLRYIRKHKEMLEQAKREQFEQAKKEYKERATAK